MVGTFKKTGLYYEHETSRGELPVCPKIHDILLKKDEIVIKEKALEWSAFSLSSQDHLEKFVR